MMSDEKGCVIVIGAIILIGLCFWGFASLVAGLVAGASS